MPAIPESDYLQAFRTAGNRLQACMDEAPEGSCGWIKARPSKPAFADLVFASGNGRHMYAVLLVAMNSQKKEKKGVAARFQIPHDDHELFLQECERYQLEPVVFPLWLGIMEPLTTGWNLFSLKDMRHVTPGEEADAPLPPMSEWELCNFCVGRVIEEIEEKQLRLLSYQDIPGIHPNIWFCDADGNRAWVDVVSCFGTELPHIPPEAYDLRRKKIPPHFTGYVARMAVTASASPGAHPLRGDLLSVEYDGLEKLP